MRDDVTLWCRTCTSCAAKASPKKTPKAAMGTVRVGAPFERIAVDKMGPLNETERRNRYIVLVQDYFSKWMEAYPVPNEQATTVAKKKLFPSGCAGTELHSAYTATKVPISSQLCSRECANCWESTRHGQHRFGRRQTAK